MTTIKPTAPTPSVGLDRVPGSPEAAAPAASFREVAAQRPDAAASTASSSAPATAAVSAGPRSAQAASASSLEALVEAVGRGELDRASAIEALVQRAVDGAKGLTPQGREALVAHLRATLASDPTVAAMLRDLDRAT